MSRDAANIRDLEITHIAALAEVHVKAFPRSAMTRLGLEAIRRYYQWLLVGPHERIALGVFERDSLVGFLFGGRFQGALTGFLRTNRRFLAWEIATHPWLVANPLVRGRIIQAARLLVPKSRSAPRTSSGASSPAFGILAIAVDPAAQGKGIGHLLMVRAEESARRASFDRMRLTVATSNAQAIAFYLGNGWKKVPTQGAWSGEMSKSLA